MWIKAKELMTYMVVLDMVYVGNELYYKVGRRYNG